MAFSLKVLITVGRYKAIKSFSLLFLQRFGGGWWKVLNIWRSRSYENWTSANNGERRGSKILSFSDNVIIEFSPIIEQCFIYSHWPPTFKKRHISTGAVHIYFPVKTMLLVSLKVAHWSKMSQNFNVWCPLKGQKYLNKLIKCLTFRWTPGTKRLEFPLKWWWLLKNLRAVIRNKKISKWDKFGLHKVWWNYN